MFNVHPPFKLRPQLAVFTRDFRYSSAAADERAERVVGNFLRPERRLTGAALRCRSDTAFTQDIVKYLLQRLSEAKCPK